MSLSIQPPSQRGRLFLIGGAERWNPMSEVLPYFVDIAGGDDARILVCAPATSDWRDTLESYTRSFGRAGAAEVWTEPLQERQDCERDDLLDRVDAATAVFFTGGDQYRLATVVSGSSFGERIRQRLGREGFLVGGTSAGAAAMSSTMIVSGPGGGSVRRADVRLGVGLGFVRDAVIDTHFNQRSRIHRLLTVFAQYPQILGIGLDEDTAIDLRLGEDFHVVGSGAVTLFDGRGSYSNATDSAEDEILALSGVTLHVLPRGYRFDPYRMQLREPSDRVRDVPTA